MSSFHKMYFAVVQLQTLSVTKHLSTLVTHLITPFGNLRIIYLDENLFLQWEHSNSFCSWYFLCFLNAMNVQNSWFHFSHFNSDALDFVCLSRFAMSWKVFLQVGHACLAGLDLMCAAEAALMCKTSQNKCHSLF